MLRRVCVEKVPRLCGSIALPAVLRVLLLAAAGCGSSGTQTIFVAVTPTPTPIPTATPSPTPTPISPFTATGKMTSPRTGHTATLLADGEVLIAGGHDDNGNILASAELYDAATGTFTATGSMNDSRENHTAALLTNGQVLIAGGEDGGGAVVATAEFYRSGHGRVYPYHREHERLARVPYCYNAGQRPGSHHWGTGSCRANLGYGGGSHDPATGNFTLTTSAFPGTGTNMIDSRERHTATLFTGGTLNGMVLLAGGIDNARVVQASTELYHPDNGSFTAAGDMTAARENQTATLLADQNVLVAGGFGVSDELFTAEFFDPTTQEFTATGNLSDERQFAAATILQTGKVLVAGGTNFD